MNTELFHATADFKRAGRSHADEINSARAFFEAASELPGIKTLGGAPQEYAAHMAETNPYLGY